MSPTIDLTAVPPPERPTRPYLSFLACFHADKTDLYVNGVPLGKLVDGVFVSHTYALPTGARPISLRDLPQPVPFKTVDELKVALIAAITAIEIAEPVAAKPEAAGLACMNVQAL